MSFLKRVSEFYDKVGKYLVSGLEYVITILVVAILGGGLFVLITQPPIEGGTSSGGIAVAYPSASFQYGAETYIVGALLLFATIGLISLFRAPNVFGQRRYSTALAALGIGALLVALIGVIYFANFKLGA
jgi:hypothetical protein